MTKEMLNPTQFKKKIIRNIITATVSLTCAFCIFLFLFFGFPLVESTAVFMMFLFVVFACLFLCSVLTLSWLILGSLLSNQVLKWENSVKGHERCSPSYRNSDSEVLRDYYWKARCFFAEKLLSGMLDGKGIGRACHMYDLEEKIKDLKHQMTIQRQAAEHRNNLLKASNLIVSCTGCEEGFFGSKEKITEGVVKSTEEIAKRLRTWWGHQKSRETHE